MVESRKVRLMKSMRENRGLFFSSLGLMCVVLSFGTIGLLPKILTIDLVVVTEFEWLQALASFIFVFGLLALGAGIGIYFERRMVQ